MTTLFVAGGLLGGLALLARKNRKSHQVLPGSRPEHEIRKEVEQDLRKWQEKALLYSL
jgi:hypothetical protein